MEHVESMVFDVKGQAMEGCEFCDNFISYHKDKMFFHLDYWYDGNGWTRITMCSRTHPWVETLFAQCGELVPPPLNDIKVLAHLLAEQTKDIAIEMPNLKVEGKSTLTFQMEGAWICTHLQIT